MAASKTRLAFSKEFSPSRLAKRSLSRMQTVFALCLLGLLIALFLDRMALYQEVAEKTAMEGCVQNMRAGLRLKTLELILRQRESQIGALVGSNPVALLGTALPNYAGEIDSGDTGRVRPGQWYFVRDLGEIRYRVMRDRNFAGQAGGPAEVRFRITAAGAESGGEDVKGLSLALLAPYQWHGSP